MLGYLIPGATQVQGLDNNWKVAPRAAKAKRYRTTNGIWVQTRPETIPCGVVMLVV